MVFSPLPGLEWAWDIVALIISLISVMLLVQINAKIEASGKLSTIVTRKVIHIFAAPIYVVTWILFTGTWLSRWLALIVPLFFVLQFVAIGTGKVKNEDFVRSMSRSGDPKELLGGTLYYAVIMVVMTIIAFYVPATADLSLATPMALIVLGCLAGGDGLADVIGRKYGGDKKFGFGGAERTVIGSIGMFIGSFLFSIILVLIFSLEATSWVIMDMVVPILIVCIVVTIVEALSPKGFDNWTVPIAAIVMILLLPYLGVYLGFTWAFPAFSLF